MMSDIELPFIPQQETTLLEDDPDIRVTFFESKFSQCLFNHENEYKASNACTLIAVLVASYCKLEKILINRPDKDLNNRLVYVLAYSIIDGNAIHESLKANGNLHNVNLTVPEAIKFAGFRAEGLTEWKSMMYLESLFQTLYTNIKKNVLEWSKKYAHRASELYIILIAGSRSVLFIIQKDSETITLVDSHQHSETKGACIAVALTQKLNILCLWYSQTIRKFYNSDPSLYELSFLYFKQAKESRKKSSKDKI